MITAIARLTRPTQRRLAHVLLPFAVSLLASCGGAEVPPEADQAGAELTADSVVALTVEAITTASIEVAAVRVARAGSTSRESALEVPGHVALDPRRVAVVSSRVEGRLERLRVVEGDRVEAGDEVASIFSTAFVTAQADVQQAVRRATLLRGTADEAGSRAIADAAEARLRLLGAPAELIESLRAGGSARELLSLHAPFSGSVLESQALPGQAITIGQAVVTVADLAEVDVVAEVPEIALPMVRVGQRASVTIAAFPERTFTGVVERLRDALDPETRTVRAILHVPNASRILRPGMYASVRLERAGTAAGPDETALLIPSSAVVMDGTETIVFVEVGERRFVRRVVRIESLAPPGSLRQDAADVLVREGLRRGERVVVRGAFTLKSELAKSAFEEHE